jgi:hypothetical protein
MKKVSDDVYKWKIMNTMQNGIPDCYFSGVKGDLWVEVKWLNKLPKKEDTLININLSPLQLRWLLNRQNEGRNVAVLVGSPDGCALFTKQYIAEKIKQSELKLTRIAVAQWIESQTLG